MAVATLAIAIPIAAPAQEAPAAQAETSKRAETPSAVQEGPKVFIGEVIARYPHSQDAYTQGLLWHDGALYESTGEVGRSWIRKVDLDSGEVLIQRSIPSDQFGEGLVLWGDELVSLTWRDGAVHRWKLDDLSPISSSSGFPFEGWGITNLGEALIFSDGTSILRVIDPETYEVQRNIEVTLNGSPIGALNELELIDGLVYANVWQTGYIVAIDPDTGVIERVLDLRPLVDEIGLRDINAVLNGIAWDAENERLFVTGKLWPTLFEIRLVETDFTIGG